MLTNVFRGLAAAMVAVFLAVSPAGAAERGSVDEAKAMAEKAAAYLKAEGKDKAFAAFNKGAEYHDRDLYVFVVDDAGATVSHGANANLVGKNLKELRDPTGKLFVQEMMAIKDSGWVDYSWQNPTTKAVEPKRSYVVRVNDVVVGVGAYVK